MEAGPQKEHHWLARLEGEWTFEGHAHAGPGKPPEKFTGSETGRSIGGFWVMLEGRGEMPEGGGPSTTIMSLGYDPESKRYRGTFMGSMMSHLWIYDGEIDQAGVLTLEAEGPSFTDAAVMTKYRDTIEFKTDDHRVMTSSYRDADGAYQQFMTVDYRRVR